jgi:hypothetical protein
MSAGIKSGQGGRGPSASPMRAAARVPRRFPARRVTTTQDGSDKCET